MPEEIERETLTVKEAAQRLGISAKSAYEAVKRGEIPVLRIGSRMLVPRDQLELLGKRVA